MTAENPGRLEGGSAPEQHPVWQRPCSCGDLSLVAHLHRRSGAMDELWHIEARHTIATIQWLIGIAEGVYGRAGISSKDDADAVLAKAINCAGGDLSRRRLEPDAYYAWVHGDEAIVLLANAIAVGLGDKVRDAWPAEILHHLAGRCGR